jgi:hypothetical protein
MGRKLTNDDFIKRSNSLHSNFYDYIEEYKNSHSKIKIICPIHGEFEQKPYSHLQGIGCPKCGFLKTAESSRKLIDTFIDTSNRIHQNKYNYDKVIYKSNKIPVTIVCPIHGDFLQSPQSHLRGYGCPGCTPKKENKSNDKFVEEANKVHSYKYTYKDEYKGAHIPININCTKHGDFLQTPNSHLRGRGCPDCQWSNSSKLENDWLDYLVIDKKYRNKRIIIDGKLFKFDAYIPETNTIYEFYGDYWHGNPNKVYKDDINHKSKETFLDLYEKTMKREDLLRNKGYNLISIWEDDYIKQIKKKKYNK